jgi:hypothetical protein
MCVIDSKKQRQKNIMRIHKMKVMGRDLGFDKNKMKERDFEWGFVVANMHIMCVCVCVCYRFQMTKK